MTRPDPVRHMMTWGAISSGIVLLLYFLLTGIFTLADIEPLTIIMLLAGIFTGFTLGGMAGVIIGAVFQHEQEAISTSKIQNRRFIVLSAVSIMVLIISRIMIIVSFGFINHPLTLSMLGAIIATIASQHYLYRLETWFKSEKPKRKLKNEDIPARLLDKQDQAILHPESQQEQQTESDY